jgi:hypothetical protein
LLTFFAMPELRPGEAGILLLFFLLELLAGLWAATVDSVPTGAATAAFMGLLILDRFFSAPAVVMVSGGTTERVAGLTAAVVRTVAANSSTCCCSCKDFA